MSRLKQKQKLQTLSGELQDHLQLLGCRTVESYQVWCQKHGFSTSLKKNWKQLARELYVFREHSASQKLLSSQQEKRHPRNMIREICLGKLKSEQVHQPQWKTLCDLIRRNRGAYKHEHFDCDLFSQVLTYLHARKTRFFDQIVPDPQRGYGNGNCYLSALSLVTVYSSHWLQPLETWKPTSKNVHRQFASLLRHLFVKYNDVPEFFDTVWFSQQEGSARRRQWYIHLGLGRNLRECDLPLSLTKRMAHFVMRAPESSTVEQALRWGQIRGLGVSDAIASQLIHTRLGEQFENEDFWLTVFHWFKAYPQVSPVQVRPIIDYLHYQRHVPVYHYNDLGIPAPAQPQLSMKGRTPAALERKVEEWHRQLNSQNEIQQQEWPGSDLKPLEILEGSYSEGTLKTWRIRELLCSQSLKIEGQKMHHCVATYAISCKRRETSIWSLECAGMTRVTKHLTIEVLLRSRTIWQVRGKCNRLATPEEMSIVTRWAEQEGLEIARWL